VSIIINSRSCSNAGFWAKHLQKVESNERVEIIGFYGLSAETIEDALSEMRGMAEASRNCRNYFSQYNINPRADYRLTEAQWEEAHKLHLQNHGLDHLPYFRVRHIKDGREHEHGIVLRVDPETGKAISDSLTAAINERTSRALEIRFGLERGESVLTPDREQERPDRRPKKHENFRTERSGIDPETVKADARAARQRADNGQSFRAALEESGDYVLARGDRRDFVIIDRGGGDHSLARRLGMKAAELRAYMADLDPASLPSVAEAKAQQISRDAQEARQRQEHGRGTGQQPAAGYGSCAPQDAAARNETSREETIEAWAQRRAANLAARGAQETTGAAHEAIDAGSKAASGVFSGLAKGAEKLLAGIFSIIDPGPKLTPEQARHAAHEAEEQATTRAQRAAEQDKEAKQDWNIFEQDRRQQQEELERRTGYRDDGRERERERDRY
jgi:hypothetical protein